MALERTVYVVHEESINAPAKIVFPLPWRRILKQTPS